MGKLTSVLLVLVLVSTILTAITFFVLRPVATSTGAPASGATLTSPVASTVSTPLTAQARVVPVRSVELSFAARGSVGENSVTEVLVREGDRVEQGALLARLDARDLELRVEEARAALAQAQADYDRLVAESSSLPLGSSPAASPATDPATTANLASATARIKQAETALKRAELALEQASLHTPIAGTVVEVNLHPGEVPSITAPAIVLADFSSWQIETSNLSEQNVVYIREGAPVTITFNAIPGLELPGKVTQIKAIGQASPNETTTTYTVVITPEQQDDRLRWNMSATVAIARSE